MPLPIFLLSLHCHNSHLNFQVSSDSVLLRLVPSVLGVFDSAGDPLVRGVGLGELVAGERAPHILPLVDAHVRPVGQHLNPAEELRELLLRRTHFSLLLLTIICAEHITAYLILLLSYSPCYQNCTNICHYQNLFINYKQHKNKSI